MAGVPTMYLGNWEILQKPFCLILPYWLTKFTNVDNNLNNMSKLLLNKPKRTWYFTGSFGKPEN